MPCERGQRKEVGSKYRNQKDHDRRERYRNTQRKTRRGREMDQNEAEGNIGGAIGHMGNG